MNDSQGSFGANEGSSAERHLAQYGMAKLEEGRRSRRSFLKNVALATGTSTAALAAGSTAQAAGKTPPVLPYQNDPNWVRNHFQNIINNETNHLMALVNELGVYARPKPSFHNIAVTNLTQFVQMGAQFCATGAGAYLGSAPYIMNPFLLAQASSIGQVELTQSGYLYTLLDQPFLPGGSPYALALTLGQVLEKLAPYVSSLNGGPEPTFTTTMSYQNDINIFNVALIQEYLEVEFYTTNFARIFPGA